ncbi:WxL protein peptidoglycan domain-containing protein [Latilactobacillus sakei]
MTMLVGMVLTLGIGTAQAAKKKSTIKLPAANKATFMLMPELPKDNIGGKQLGYFNLHIKPNQVKTIRIKVYNPTEHMINIYGQVKDATTNDNATVDYLGSHSIDKHLLKKPGSRLVTVPKKTSLPAGATKRIAIKIKTNDSFKGTKATAINLSADQFNQKSAVKNAYRYAIGLILNGQQLEKRDYWYLESPSIKTRFTQAGKAAISVKLNNPDPVYLEKAKVKIKLQNQKWGFIQYTTSVKNGKMAPNTSFYIDLLLGGKRLVPGTYDMTLTTKSSQYTKTIHKDVLITASQAKYINGLNAAYLRNRNWILGGIAITLVIIGGVFFRVHRVRKRKRDLHAKNGK